jgi:hypothetical protein
LKRKAARRACAEATRDGLLNSVGFLLKLKGNQQANYHCEQGQTFDKGGYNQHGGLDFARSVGLTADGIHGAAADAANAQASAQCYQTSADTSTHYGQTSRIRNSGHGLQQQRKQHTKRGKEKKMVKICRDRRGGGGVQRAGATKGNRTTSSQPAGA